MTDIVMDVVYHLAKVLTESHVHAVRIIWMANTVSKLKGSHCLLLEKCQSNGSKVLLLGLKLFDITLAMKILELVCS